MDFLLTIYWSITAKFANEWNTFLCLDETLGENETIISLHKRSLGYLKLAANIHVIWLGLDYIQIGFQVF